MSSGDNRGNKQQGKKVRFNEYEETTERVQPSPIQEPTAHAEDSYSSNDPKMNKAHIAVDIESLPTSPTSYENAVLEQERRESRAWMNELGWTIFVIIPLFLIVTIGIYWTLTPAPPKQRVVVQLPDNAGFVAVTPAKNAWDTPRVVAVYNAPRQKQADPTKTSPEQQSPKIVKREVPKESELTKETEVASEK